MSGKHSGPAGQHPIRIVAARTGLSPDVLRAWERRYGVVEPRRGPGGQRLYSDADVERLHLLQRATSAGRSIGQVAEASLAELQGLIAADDAARARLDAALGPAVDENRLAAAYLERAWSAVRDIEAERLEIVLRQALFALGGTAWIERLVAPLLRRIGDGWEAGALSPAHEHAASAVARRVLDSLAIDIPPGAPGMVIATPAGERHEFGAMLAAATAGIAGWRVLYLGADLPAANIAAAARQSGARLVGISVVDADRLPRVREEMRSLVEALEERVPLVIGGRAAGPLGRAIKGSRAHVVLELSDFRALLARLRLSADAGDAA